MAAPPGDQVLHGTTVAVGGRAVLILGAAGRGKSALAIQLVSLGADLVADDRTVVWRDGDQLMATAPPSISGLIEIRGAGILSLPTRPSARVALVVDLDTAAVDRLPDPESLPLLGCHLPLFRRMDGPHFPSTIVQALRHGAPTANAGPMSDRTIIGHSAPSDHEDGQRLVFVTGPSGAGRSTAIAALEDLGFETIDNLPLSLLPRLLDGPAPARPLALGIDVRNRDFSTDGFLETLNRLDQREDLTVEALYLDASPDVLSRRYSETRRRHPLAPGETPEDGILRESQILAPLRRRAGILVDTSDLTPHDLRAELERLFGGDAAPGLSVSVQSFSFKRGLPRGLDTVFDVRFLQNPHWQPELRPLTGLDPAVAGHVAADPRFDAFVTRVRELALFLLPAYAAEGKTHFAVGFGCTGGKHRSVTLAETLAKALAEAGWSVSIRHRELERRSGKVPGA